MLTAETLKKIMPNCDAHTFGPLLALAMGEFEINTPKRQAAFLAQVAHESGECRWLREFATGEAYEGRRDLGNTHEGDGRRYKGRGLIQITGRSNYVSVAASLGLDCVTHPELLEQPENACRTAAWWWKDRGLNELADIDAFDRITRRINGGTNGAAERHTYWERTKAVLGA